MAEIAEDSLEGNAKSLYDSISSGVKATMYAAAYNEGTTAYANGDYTTAAEKLKRATEIDETQYDAWYYLSFAYVNLGDTTNADQTLAETIRRFPAYDATLRPYMTDQSVLNSGSAENTDEGTDEANVDVNEDGTVG